MKTQLLVATRVYRKKFIIEYFSGSDDIFALVTDGSFVVESDKGKNVIQKYEGMLFRKNTLYHRKIIKPVKMYLFRYRSEDALFSTDHVVFRDQTRLITTIEALEKLDSDVFLNDFEYRNHLFFDLVMQYAMENNKSQVKDSKIEPIIDEIRKSLHRGVDLKELASKSGLSYPQFFRRFKICTGLNPSEYINALRLQKAKILLTDTDLLVLEISDACGFENEYYFSNFFKKHTLLSPRAFRIASKS